MQLRLALSFLQTNRVFGLAYAHPLCSSLDLWSKQFHGLDTRDETDTKSPRQRLIGGRVGFTFIGSRILLGPAPASERRTITVYSCYAYVDEI